MRISTQRETLFAQLQTVTRAASTRSAVQALSGVQLLAAAGGIELRATDMEIGLRVPLDGEVVREGAVVLPARLLVDVVRSLPGSEVVARAARRRAGRRDRRRRRDVPHPHAAPRGLPAVPGAGRRRPRAGARRGVRRHVAKVARSASRDETRPVLTGILVSASGTELRMVATDSYRLSVKETKLEEPLQGSFEANVPARALQELGRIVGSAAEERAERRGADEPGDLRGRRRRALVAPDRRPVPEPPPTAAGRVRARAPARRRRDHRRRAAHLAARAEERAAAAGVHARAS